MMWCARVNTIEFDSKSRIVFFEIQSYNIIGFVSHFIYNWNVILVCLEYGM